MMVVIMNGDGNFLMRNSKNDWVDGLFWFEGTELLVKFMLIFIYPPICFLTDLLSVVVLIFVYYIFIFVYCLESVDCAYCVLLQAASILCCTCSFSSFIYLCVYVILWELVYFNSYLRYIILNTLPLSYVLLQFVVPKCNYFLNVQIVFYIPQKVIEKYFRVIKFIFIYVPFG